MRDRPPIHGTLQGAAGGVCDIGSARGAHFPWFAMLKAIPEGFQYSTQGGSQTRNRNELHAPYPFLDRPRHCRTCLRLGWETLAGKPAEPPEPFALFYDQDSVEALGSVTQAIGQGRSRTGCRHVRLHVFPGAMGQIIDRLHPVGMPGDGMPCDHGRTLFQCDRLDREGRGRADHPHQSTRRASRV